MSHLLDDFFFIGPVNSMSCKNDLTILFLCKTIGVPIKMAKTQTPTTKITIYGIEIDSDLMESCLPSDKVDKIKGHFLHMIHRNHTILRKLQSLIGLLNFACSVVVSGRAFLRSLIDLTRGVTKSATCIHLKMRTLRLTCKFG